MEVKGSVALITGAGNGIGQAVAKHLASKGAKLILVDRVEADAQKTADAVAAMGTEAIAIGADVTSEAYTARFIEAGLTKFGKLNMAVACAGVIRDGLMLSPDKATGKIGKKLGLDKWQQVIDVNLTGTFLTLRDAAEAMANGGWPGLLVTISSVNKVGQVGQLNY